MLHVVLPRFQGCKGKGIQPGKRLNKGAGSINIFFDIDGIWFEI